MNRKNILIATLFAIIGLTAKAQLVKHINSVEFQKISTSMKGTLLDVRTETEFANGHLPKAGQLNYYAFDFHKKLLLLPKNEPIFLYCNTGWRSKRAAETLVKNGYTQVYNLKQGIMEWELLNLPVVLEPNAHPDQTDKMEADEFSQLINTEELVLIDFYAPWCGPCRQMMPMIDSLQHEYAGKITIVKINADASKKLVKSLQLSGVPYFALYRNGKQLFNRSGPITRDQIIQLFNENQR
ncbi:MAG: redoxin domain-containing protein [Prolixibacteraceae bacterium]|nr:redoxin domain-containing protein [Prolixibacteraceae bacterium]